MREKFTPGEWFLGIPFHYKYSISEWCNVYADGETSPIATVLMNNGFDKEYYNDTLIKAAPDLYNALKDLVGNSRENWQEVNVSKETIDKALKALKKARGEV